MSTTKDMRSVEIDGPIVAIHCVGGNKARRALERARASHARGRAGRTCDTSTEQSHMPACIAWRFACTSNSRHFEAAERRKFAKQF